MVRMVAILEMERQRLITAEKEAKNLVKEKKEKTRLPDEVFPRSGKPWAPDDLDLIYSIIADIPDDRIDDHILWLSKKLQRPSP